MGFIKNHSMSFICLVVAAGLAYLCGATQQTTGIAFEVSVTESNGKAVASSPSSGQINMTSLIEEFNFVINDFKVDHQAEIKNLNILINPSC